MINHIRTLLLNTRGGASQRPGVPGAEYVPPAYRVRALSPMLAAARQALFGVQPDPLYLNYRLRQVLRLLHSTELAEYVYALDRRITYLPFDDSFFDQVFGVAVAQTAGDPAPLYVGGEPAGSGNLQQVWEVRADADSYQVALERPVVVQSGTTAFSGGLSDPIALPNSPLTVRFHEGTAVWTVTSTARPAADFGAVLAQLGRTMRPYLMALFGALAVEPYKTFQSVYQTHPLAAYQYSALLLAVAYRINELPPTGGA